MEVVPEVFDTLEPSMENENTAVTEVSNTPDLPQNDPLSDGEVESECSSEPDPELQEDTENGTFVPVCRENKRKLFDLSKLKHRKGKKNANTQQVNPQKHTYNTAKHV